MRGATIKLSAASVQSFRRLKAHNQNRIFGAALPSGVDRGEPQAERARRDPAEQARAQKPEKKIGVKAAT
ncbi:MAG: hypothetical protein WAK55_31100 [Xanthobacteraceae bacterium]